MLLSYVSGSVGAGASVTEHKTIPADIIDIVKIKVTPSNASGTSEVFIYKKDTALSADLLFATKAFNNSSPLIHPIEDNAGLTAERSTGYLLRYEDLDATGELHIKIKNNHSVGMTYTVEITYYINPASTVINGTVANPVIFTNFADRALWVPLYHPKVVLTFNGDGSLSVVNQTSDSADALEAFAGIRSRFKLYPDATGVAKYRVKFTNYAHGPGASFYENFLGIAFRTGVDTWRAFGVRASDATRGGVAHGANTWSGAVGFFGTASDFIDPKPVTYIEIEITIGYDTTSTDMYRITSFRYKTDGSSTPNAWINFAVSGLDVGANLIFHEFLVGMFNRTGVRGSFGAKLTEFELIQGQAAA